MAEDNPTAYGCLSVDTRYTANRLVDYPCIRARDHIDECESADGTRWVRLRELNRRDRVAAGLNA